MRLTAPTTVVCVVSATAVALTAAVTPASAKLRPSDFPSASKVRAVLEGSGRWQRKWRQPVVMIGSRPARCDSARPFRDASQGLSASYSKRRIPWDQQQDKWATVTVYEYESAESARAAVAAARTLANSCPKSTEWYCTQCDGVITYWRSPVGRPPVGASATSWIGKTEDLGRTRYRTVVASSRNLVLEITLYTGTRPGTTPFRFPPVTPSRKKAVRLTREILSSAR